MSINYGYALFKDGNTTYNQTVPVVCNDGFEILGDPFIVCLHNGLWGNGSNCVAKGLLNFPTLTCFAVHKFVVNYIEIDGPDEKIYKRTNVAIYAPFYYKN